MFNTKNFAEMANAVYRLDANKHFVSGYEPKTFDEEKRWGWTRTDFKGCVYIDDASKAFAVAFQGTVPKKIGDLVADLQIVGGILPLYCSAALRLFDVARARLGGYAPYLVGHSLGGAVAQVIGHWMNIPFVTFNAPGMWGFIQLAKVLDWTPDGYYSLKGTFQGTAFDKQRASVGRNFRNIFDPVSGYGSHYGPVTRFWCGNFHSMDDMEAYIKRSGWADKNPLDPKNKEWGELD
jgi:hypothetical protein